MAAYNTQPGIPDVFQVLGIRPEEAKHGFVEIAIQGEVTDDGGNAKFVRTNQKPDKNCDKPAESSPAREAIFKFI